VVGRCLADNAGAIEGDLLDLGAGNQPFRPWYEPLAKSVVAVDAAPAPGLDVLSYAAPLAFRDASFDAVLCMSVLEHVDNAEAAIAEVARTLRPGGRLIITAPFLYPTTKRRMTSGAPLTSDFGRFSNDTDSTSARSRPGGPFLLIAHYLIGGAQALCA
jgi:2-polyprenyl-3-methyl-5-hydroxy-6-metoxy-1,4-benzoquinol methylase